MNYSNHPMIHARADLATCSSSNDPQQVTKTSNSLCVQVISLIESILNYLLSLVTLSNLHSNFNTLLKTNRISENRYFIQ